MNDLITVVIPIYNVEKYLHKCVDSIINQTYKNLEIILVDDGSPDRCGIICDNYASIDNRITVIHKANGGLSDARNVAINKASGRYITFIDSDDYVDIVYIEYLYRLIKRYSADISVCTFNYITEEGRIINHVLNNDTVKVMNLEEGLYELLNSKLFSNSAWAKLYKIECFENIRFPYGKIYEDVATIYKAFMKSNLIVWGEKSLYNYLFRESSISKQKFSKKRLLALDYAKTMVSEIVDRYPQLRPIGKCRLFDSYISILKQMDIENDSTILNDVLKMAKSERRTVLFYKKAGIKRKINALILFFPKKILINLIK